jgi:hypothetical protein
MYVYENILSKTINGIDPYYVTILTLLLQKTNCHANYNLNRNYNHTFFITTKFTYFLK